MDPLFALYLYLGTGLLLSLAGLILCWKRWAVLEFVLVLIVLSICWPLVYVVIFSQSVKDEWF